jgi:hypothetical protein
MNVVEKDISGVSAAAAPPCPIKAVSLSLAAVAVALASIVDTLVADLTTELTPLAPDTNSEERPRPNPLNIVFTVSLLQPFDSLENKKKSKEMIKQNI